KGYRRLVERGKCRRKRRPYLFFSGCAVKSRMTVIGFPNGALLDNYHSLLLLFIFYGFLQSALAGFFVTKNHLSHKRISGKEGINLYEKNQSCCCRRNWYGRQNIPESSGRKT